MPSAPVPAERGTVILGAGLAGLSASYHLGGQAPIYESAEKVGGLCSSRQVNGFTFDFTGHLLHFRLAYTRELVARLLDEPLVHHRRNSWIYLKGSWIKYPFQANLHDLPEEARRECLDEFLAVQGRRGRSRDFQEWILNHFGRGIARHFMIPYNEKLWRYPLDRMSCAWIDSLIPQPVPDEVIKGAAGPPPRQYGYNIEFAYPRRGGIERLAQAFVPHVGPIRFGSRAVRIDTRRRVVAFADGHEAPYRTLVSTMPLPALVRLLDPCPPEIADLGRRLVWNSLVNINLGLDRPPETERHWIYFPEPEFAFYRVGYPSSFSPHVAPPGKSSMYIEVSFRGENLFRPEELVSRVLADLGRVGLVRDPADVVATEYNVLPYAYVIYDLDYGQVTRALHEYLEGQGIHSIGRFGRWRYYSMEQTMMDGKECAERILGSVPASR